MNESELMTREEMESRFDSEWVLIGEPENDETMRLLRGRVLFHSPDRNEVYRVAKESAPGHCAVLFFGKRPEHLILRL